MTDSEERELDARLRPTKLEEFVGQSKVVSQISLIIQAAKLDKRTPDHILLAGPPGLGKTTLAMIVAHESEKSLRLSSGPAIQSAGDLAAAVKTAVINKRAGGQGLISGRKAFQRPMNEGIELLNAIQDVYLDTKITIA